MQLTAAGRAAATRADAILDEPPAGLREVPAEDLAAVLRVLDRSGLITFPHAGRVRQARRAEASVGVCGAAGRLLPHRGEGVSVAGAQAAPLASAVPGAESLRGSSAFCNTLRGGGRGGLSWES